MNRYLKIILFFLITFLLPVGIHFSLATAEVREADSYDVVYSSCDDIHFAALSLPALPDGELSSVQTLPVHIARIQRVLSHEYVVALRQALLSFSDSTNLLSMHLCRICSSTVSHRCVPSCKYYIFALRQILV